MSKLLQHPTSRLDRTEPITVPKVRLYVERPECQGTWFVNVGHVTERGRWRTEAHAHPAYGQVIFVSNGRGVVNLEGRSVPFEGPCALVLPTDCVHGLDYERDVDRWVVTIEVTYLAQVNSRLSEFIQLWTRPRVLPFGTDEADEFHRLMVRLKDEGDARRIGHVVAMEALLTSLLMMLVRGNETGDEERDDSTPGATRLTDRFRDLVDLHYRQHLALQDFVSMMAVSAAQLRAACATVLGQSPTKVIHARLVVEAKRGLIFGDMSVEQIAYWLGFSDAAYFTRFFKKEVGQSPSQFRSSARDLPHRHAA